MNQRNENNERHGYWEHYYSDGTLMFKGYYINGKANGYWKEYHRNGTLWYKRNYLNGREIGFWMYNNIRTEFYL
jgi:antitoxin component YwqK of YwqJK toxin-antitoxin module